MPKTHTFQIRGIPMKTWRAFAARVAADGNTLNAALLRLIERFADRRKP